MPLELTQTERMTHSTARIESELQDGSVATGTGFFYAFLQEGEKHVPVIITNKHVVADAVELRFSLTLQGTDGLPTVGQHIRLRLRGVEPLWVDHPNPDVDLCAMPLAPLLRKAADAGRRFFFVTLDDTSLPDESDLRSLGAMEDIVMIGYPNGIWDSSNNMPIVRRGITATHPCLNYEGRGEFLIDAACFPGSSGSPVFLFNQGSWVDRSGNVSVGGPRVKLLGVLCAGPQYTATGDVMIVDIPTQQRAIALSSIPINLGLVIKSNRITELGAAIRKAFPRAASQVAHPK